MRFHAKAISREGAVLNMTLDAGNDRDAAHVIHSQGLTLLSLKRESSILDRISRGASNFPLSLFSQELKVLLAAGVSLVEALDTLAEREGKMQFRSIIVRLVQYIKEGQTLADAMEHIPEAFPPLYCASIRASETSGEIVAALDRYLTYQGQIDVIRKKVISASVYPAMIILFGGVVLLFMLGYVVPRFSAIYADRGDAVSQASRILLVTGQFIAAHGWQLLAYLLAGLVALGLWLRQASTRARISAGFQRIPAIGEKLRTFQLARLYRTLGMLVRGGIPITHALQMAVGILPPGLRAKLEAARSEVAQGQSLSEAFRAHALSTPVAFRLIRVAEQTGSMSEMLESAAAFHEEELARDVDIFTRLFEPILMMAIGLLVGLIVLLMYLPIFELAGSIE